MLGMVNARFSRAITGQLGPILAGFFNNRVSRTSYFRDARARCGKRSGSASNRALARRNRLKHHPFRCPKNALLRDRSGQATLEHEIISATPLIAPAVIIRESG
jgi:hypothetical protein